MNPLPRIACSIVLVLAVGSSAWAQSLTRGPYLQSGNTSAVTVRWRTSSSTDSVVRYGTAPGSLTLTATNATPKTEHVIRVTGLAANATYYYSVGNSTTTFASGSDYFFITAPVGAKPTRVWVLGDAGTAGSFQRSVRDAYYTFTGSRHTDLWLMLGDNAYDSGTDAEYQAAVFNMYPTMLRKSVLWPTLGNHDGVSADSGSQTGPYYDMFTLPKAAEAGGIASGTEAYYSFDYGNIHFVCLDSTDTNRSSNGAMATWLRNDLSNNNKDWSVAFWHHPPYSKGSHNSDTETELVQMRQAFLPILEEHGVDLVLCGHSHSYERSQFIDGHYGSSSTFNSSMVVQPGSGRTDGSGAYTKTATGPLPFAGAVYTVAGASGQLGGGTLNHPAMFLSLNVLGSVILDFDNNRLDVQYIDNNRARRDYFTILKGVAGNNPPNVSITSPANGATFTAPANVTIDATASDSDGMVTNVDFYAGSTLIGTDSTFPYGIVWNNAPVGTHSLTAVATDNGNATRASAAVSISVNNPGGTSTTVSFQDGANGYAGTRDTCLKSNAPTKNSGNSTVLQIDGTPDVAVLLKWDLSSIPVGKQVTAVTLNFYVENASPTAYEFYALKRDWLEQTATWNQASAGMSWQVPGANGVADRGTTVLGSISASSKGFQTIKLNADGVAQVQSWINTPASNFGFILLDAANTDDLKLTSSEKNTIANRPKITVTYQ